MKTAAAVFVIVFAAVAVADDDPIQKRYIEAGKKQKADEEAVIGERLAKLKATEAAVKKSKGKTQAKDLKAVQGRIKEAEAELAALKKQDFVTPKLYPLDLKVGDVGIVWVVNANPGPVQYEAFQVIDKNNVIIRFSNRLHWYKTDTNGMIDGKKYTLDKIVHVKGTKTYEAAVGTKTVLELEEWTPPKKGDK